jgi:SIR2-like domain
MQFVNNGPDVPDELLQAHTDGRVVFFCGAGIAYPAGLPGFKDLVENIYGRLRTSLNPNEQCLFNRDQYDTCLNLLERRMGGHPGSVRGELHQILTPKQSPSESSTHDALLQLALHQDSSKTLRLVTTNFDRIFEQRIEALELNVARYAAPLLPIPKVSCWNGLVYLHGLLPAVCNDLKGQEALKDLVVTSADFGKAYLTERWAARFVTELFRNHVVCFVGYSINDPVMRYIMDALAADQAQGEAKVPVYAFGDYERNDNWSRQAAKESWQDKGVKPILYAVPAVPADETKPDHSALHRTLKAWADIYRDGVQGKERIVETYARLHPTQSTLQDDFVGRMVWALSCDTGLPARRFAEINPVPSLDWLQALSDTTRFKNQDLSRFGVSPRSDYDDKLSFSLLCRPAPYIKGSWMSLVSGGNSFIAWDSVLDNMANWLLRHLNDPQLAVWLCQNGGQLHEGLIHLIDKQLEKIALLERSGKPEDTDELNQLRTQAPNAVPQPMMRKLWGVFLARRVKSNNRFNGMGFGLYQWKNRLQQTGLTPSLRMELRELLAPKVTLNKWSDDMRDLMTAHSDGANPTQKLNTLLNWELVLTADGVHHWYEQQQNENGWQAVLPHLADDFQLLLRDALELSEELGADEMKDGISYICLPSVHPHWQNRGFTDWVVLVEMLRDAWLAVRTHEPVRATRMAQGWFDMPYTLFKRLALFSASQGGCIAGEQWASWLLTDDGWCLWSLQTQREAMRLLVLQGANLNPQDQTRLEAAMLAGKPKEMQPEHTDADQWATLIEHGAWLRLIKLQSSGAQLGSEAAQRLAELSQKHPDLQLNAHEREEFAGWMSSTGDPDFEESRQVDLAPRNREALVLWLKNHPQTPHFAEDNWRKTCRERFWPCCFALRDLAQENIWPIGRWNDAFYVWSSDARMCQRSWRWLAPWVHAIPDERLFEMARGLSDWLKTVSGAISQHQDVFFNLADRLLSLDLAGGVESQKPVTTAINHPVGRITQALLNCWFQREPQDGDGLPGDVKPLFTNLCDVNVERFRHGRVLLAANLIALFRVDRAWTETHVLPLFDWQRNPAEAHAVWDGFLWTARLHPPLMTAFKAAFLDTAHHTAKLLEHRHMYIGLLTHATLESSNLFTEPELQTAFGALQADDLSKSASHMVNVLDSSGGEQREAYWSNRIAPFLQTIWPRSQQKASTELSQNFALLAIAAPGQFEQAWSLVKSWVKPIDNPDYVFHQLCQANLAKAHPNEVLDLLERITVLKPIWVPQEFQRCLDALATAEPNLRQDARYKRLDIIARQAR